MKFNNKILYALMAAGLMMPTASIQAWSWKWGGAAPLLKNSEQKVQEQAAKTATDYAIAGAKTVGKATGTLAVNAVKEVGGYVGNTVAKRPLLTAAVVGSGIWAYRNWETVKEKYEQAKQVAKVVAPIAGVMLGAKVTKDAYDAYKSLFANQEASEQDKPASKNVAVSNNVSGSAITDKEAQELYALWDEAEKTEAPKAAPVIAQKELQQFEHIYEQSDVLKRAQARIQQAGLTPREVQQMDNAWIQAVAQNDAQHVDQALAQISEKQVPQATFMPRVHRDDVVLHEQVKRQMLERAQARIPAWVKEYHELEEQETPEWVQEFNNKYLNRAVIIARQLVESNDAEREERAKMIANDIRNISNAASCDAPAVLFSQPQ